MALRMRMYNESAEAFEAVCLDDMAQAVAIAKEAVDSGEWQGIEIFDEAAARLHIEGVIPDNAAR